MRWSKILRPMSPFEELAAIEALVERAEKFGTVECEERLSYKGTLYPVYSVSFGNMKKSAPALLIVGGVHGLEKIGTHVAMALLNYTLELMEWDETIRSILEKSRLVFLPLANPVGMHIGRRSNGNGVDLMRNAPVEAQVEPKVPLIAGHRLGAFLPWYRGEEGQPMEREALVLQSLVRKVVHGSKFAVSLDIHSGFGAMDRLWFPYAHSRKPFVSISEVFQMKQLLDRNLQNHIYQFEPQCHQYTTHGDLWDYFHYDYAEKNEEPYLPLCLEIGSWAWVKKNPKQLLTSLGAFNPILPHRMARALRRHIPLFDFLLRLVSSHENWLEKQQSSREDLERQAAHLWFPEVARKSPQV